MCIRARNGKCDHICHLATCHVLVRSQALVDHTSIFTCCMAEKIKILNIRLVFRHESLSAVSIQSDKGPLSLPLWQSSLSSAHGHGSQENLIVSLRTINQFCHTGNMYLSNNIIMLISSLHHMAVVARKLALTNRKPQSSTPN